MLDLVRSELLYLRCQYNVDVSVLICLPPTTRTTLLHSTMFIMRLFQCFTVLMEQGILAAMVGASLFSLLVQLCTCSALVR